MSAAELDLDQAQFVARLAVARVLTLDAEPTRLRDLWREGRTVTTFLRHFGCLFCHQMVHDVIDALPHIRDLGGRLVLVGNGSIAQAQRFYANKGLPREGVVIATDPERDSYRALELERGYARTFFNPGSQRAYKSARNEGHKITGLSGDLTQLGGVLVTQPPARVLYLHRSRFAGDHPEIALVLAALRA